MPWIISEKHRMLSIREGNLKPIPVENQKELAQGIFMICIFVQQFPDHFPPVCSACLANQWCHAIIWGRNLTKSQNGGRNSQNCGLILDKKMPTAHVQRVENQKLAEAFYNSSISYQECHVFDVVATKLCSCPLTKSAGVDKRIVKELNQQAELLLAWYKLSLINSHPYWV